MEIKVNVETNAEEREDVELFEQLFDIDDAEYQRERKLSFFVCNAKRRQSDVFVRQERKRNPARGF